MQPLKLGLAVRCFAFPIGPSAAAAAAAVLTHGCSGRAEPTAQRLQGKIKQRDPSQGSVCLTC